MRRKGITCRRVLFLILAAVLAAACFSGCSARGGGSAGSPAASPAPTQTPEGDTVTMSISCAAILENMDRLDPDKTELIPEDGWILEPTVFPLEEGESVFDLLLWVTREKKIHMEYSEAPLYGSAYIEGIHNLYEFDCGEVSGWMYSVNGWYPNYGCSGYKLEPGDVVEWRFTCDGGDDIGGGYMPEE